MATRVREAAVTRKVLAFLRDRGAYAEKIHGDAFQSSLLDTVVCYRGYFISIEVKRPGEQPTPRQLHEIDRIEKAGGIALVVDSVEPLSKILDGIDYATLQRDT